ncbi:MAG: hypothetical protein ACKPKO_48275, partial [Candidatus Fonsibacter sp.]
MFIDVWRPMHKLTGIFCKHKAAVAVKVKSIHVVLQEETVRQNKARGRGSNSYTLVHTLTLASNMELVPDMCREN